MIRRSSQNRILKIWSEGGVVINGRLYNPGTHSADFMAELGYDSLTVALRAILYAGAEYMKYADSSMLPRP